MTARHDQPTIVPEQPAAFPAMPAVEQWRRIDPRMRAKLACRWYAAMNQLEGPPGPPPPWTDVALVAHRVATRRALGLLVAVQRWGQVALDAERLRSAAHAGYALAESCSRMQQLTDGLLADERFAAADTEMIPRQHAEQVPS